MVLHVGCTWPSQSCSAKGTCHANAGGGGLARLGEHYLETVGVVDAWVVGLAEADRRISRKIIL